MRWHLGMIADRRLAYHTMWLNGHGEVRVRVITWSDSQHGLFCSLHDALQILQGILQAHRRTITQGGSLIEKLL